MARRSIHIESFKHLTGIPVATRIGPLVVSSVIPPYNPGTRDTPDEVDAQIDNLFGHMGQMLEAAGASWNDMAKITFYVKDYSVRDAIEAAWLKHFPDASSRPSRYTQVSQPPGNAAATCEFLAYVE